MSCFNGLKRKVGQYNEGTTQVTQIGTDKAVDQSRPASASSVSPEFEVVQEYDQNNQQKKPHEKYINKQQASDHHVEVLCDKEKNIKKERKKSKKEKKKRKKEQLRTMEEQNLEYQRSVEKLKEKILRQEHKIQDLKDANDELLTRLSAMAGARLTDGNANIADLSDENRPTKLAEQFSELYDNEWTDAFEVLTVNKYLPEQNACHVLLKAICASYINSKEKADNDRQNMTEAMKKFLGDKEPPSELIKQLKDLRKKNFDGHIKLLKQDLTKSVKALFPDEEMRKKEGLKQFLNKALKLCWLMVIQDPPVFMDIHIEERGGEEHNSNTLKPFTKSGQYIDYIVWPPLYLKEGGDVLWKGIAQFKSAITSNLTSDDRTISSGNEGMVSKTDQDVEEPTGETQKSENKQENAETSAHNVNTYHEKSEASTFRGQMPSSDTDSSSVMKPFATENGKEPEKVDLNQKLRVENKNNLKVDLENYIATDEPSQIKEIEKSENLSNAHALDSDHGTNAVTHDITNHETAIISEEKGLDKETEADIGHDMGLTVTTINKDISTFNSKPDHCYESKSKTTSSNTKSSAKKKKDNTNKTRTTKESKDDKSTKELKPK